MAHAGDGSPSSLWRASPVWPDDIRCKFPNNILDSLELTQFENREYYIFSDYDLILRDLYGDYMVPPNEKEQIGYHFNSLKWKI